jgi:hypothetical protein
MNLEQLIDSLTPDQKQGLIDFFTIANEDSLQLKDIEAALADRASQLLLFLKGCIGRNIDPAPVTWCGVEEIEVNWSEYLEEFR